jgi:hypothetical protein
MNPRGIEREGEGEVEFDSPWLKIDGAVALKTEETVTPDGFVSGPGNGQVEHLIELKLLEQLDIVVDHAVPKP